MRKTLGALLATATAVTGATFGAVPAAHADTILATCTEGSANIQVSEDTGAVTGTATLDGCTAVGNPNIHSATITISGHAPVRTFLEIVTVTTDTITWNTGQTTTETVERTFTGPGTVIEAGAGESVAGLFHPSVEAETGTGTRTNPSGLSINDAENNLIALTVDFEVNISSVDVDVT